MATYTWQNILNKPRTEQEAWGREFTRRLYSEGQERFRSYDASRIRLDGQDWLVTDDGVTVLLQMVGQLDRIDFWWEEEVQT